MRWIDESKLVKFVEEGREAEMDQMMSNQSSEMVKDAGDAKP